MSPTPTLSSFPPPSGPGNSEYDEALRTGRNMVRRADALAAIMNCKKGIVVCGMHGKTTTSSMAAHVLKVGELRPSHYVGAEIPILGTNALLGPGGRALRGGGGRKRWHPGALPSGTRDRPEHRGGAPRLLRRSGGDRSRLSTTCSTQTRGKVVLLRRRRERGARLRRRIPAPFCTAESHAAHYRFDDVHIEGLPVAFRVLRGGEHARGVTLNVPGRHNVSNAVSVIALATELGVPFRKYRRGARDLSRRETAL